MTNSVTRTHTVTYPETTTLCRGTHTQKQITAVQATLAVVAAGEEVLVFMCTVTAEEVMVDSMLRRRKQQGCSLQKRWPWGRWCSTTAELVTANQEITELMALKLEDVELVVAEREAVKREAKEQTAAEQAATEL